MNLKQFLFVTAGCVISVLLSDPSFAAGSLSGHAGIMSYSYDDTLEDGQAELLSQLSFKIKDNTGLTYRFSGRLREPLTDGPEEDLNIYSSYLGWVSPQKRVTITAGRRLLYSGVVRGIQDGGVIELRRLHTNTNFSLTMTVGKQAADGYETGPADNPNPWVLGFIVSANPLRTVDVKLSSLFNLEDKEDGSECSDLVGFSARWKPTGTVSVDGLVDHDLTRERVERSQGRLSYHSPDFSVSVEHLYAASPWISPHSWYSRFEEYLESYSQYRFGFRAKIPSVDWSSTGLYWILQDDDQSVNGYLSLWKKLTVGYRFSGDGDSRKSGFYGQLGHRFKQVFRVDAGADFSRYKIYSLYNLPAHGSYLRFGYTPLPSWQFNGEVQYRKNRMMDQDMRLLLVVRHRFSTSYGNKSH